MANEQKQSVVEKSTTHILMHNEFSIRSRNSMTQPNRTEPNQNEKGNT